VGPHAFDFAIVGILVKFKAFGPLFFRFLRLRPSLTFKLSHASAIPQDKQAPGFRFVVGIGICPLFFAFKFVVVSLIDLLVIRS